MVHPRVRGEHLYMNHWTVLGCGSSPRARGTRKDKHGTFRIARFIPACAGNTHVPLTVATGPTVHPRVRGEHSVNRARRQLQTGSSPRARGTPDTTVRDAVRNRFIPACAGNTGRGKRRRLPPTVHPRVRGEHPIARHHVSNVTGSSPRARGTLAAARLNALPPRFIPACAGNTTGAWKRWASPPVHPRVRGEHSSCRRL